MKVYPEGLAANLDKGLAPIYLVAGNELLLVEEAVDAIRQTARSAGVAEREVLHVETGFRWESLRESSGNMSLFAEQRLIELRIPTGKPGDAGAKALQAYIKQPPEDTVLVVICGSLDGRKGKWYGALERAGVAVECWPVERSRLPQWIQQRFRQHQLNADRGAIDALAHYTEGNLLAAAQNIEQLALLYPNQTVDEVAIEKVVADNARFDAFVYSDALLSGDQQRLPRILNSLQQEGLSAVPVVAAASRECRDVTSIASTGSPLGRTWPKREKQLRQAASRHSPQRWQYLLLKLSRLDALAKGQASGNVWNELLDWSMRVAASSNRK